MLLHKANRYLLAPRGPVRAAGLVLALAGGVLAQPDPPPGPPTDPAPSRPSDPAPGRPADPAPIEIETIGGRESIPLADASRLSISGAGAGGSRELILDARRIPVADLLSIRFPTGPTNTAPGEPRETAPFLLLLRSGAEVAGTVTGGDDSFIHFRAALIGDEPRSIRVEDVKGLIVEAVSGEVPRRPTDPARGSPTDPAAGRPTDPAPGRPAAAPARGDSAAAARERSARQRIRNQIAKWKLEKDAIVLLEGGRVEGVLDRFEEDGVRFGSDTLGDVKLAYGKLRAVLLAAVGERSPGTGSPGKTPEARVTLRGGTSLTAAVTGLSSGKLSLHEPVLGAVDVSLGDVLDVAFQNGRSVYVSDREPIKVVERLGPAFRKTMPHRNDENVLGEPLRMGGREHRKGLGVHSYSLLEYDLAGEFARFQAVIGLDESARPAEGEPILAGVAEVVFRVRVDGKLLLEKAMSWRDPPIPIDVPLDANQPATGDTVPSPTNTAPTTAAGAKARTLSLEVDYGAPEGGFNFALDRANWAEARIVR